MNQNPPGEMPGTNSGSAVYVPAEISLTSAAQQYLDQTRPWVRFLSVMTFIGAAFMVIAAIAMIMVGMVAPRFASAGGGRFGPLGSAAGGLLYIVMAIVYIAPGVFLSRYAGAIKLLETSRSAQALEDALRNQKSFWRYVGILAVICLVLVAISIVLGLIFAALLIRR